MISSRRVALLGLTTPLSAIMLAVLGIWPEDEDQPEPLPVYTAVYGGGGGTAVARKAPRIREREPDEESAAEWLRRLQRRRVICMLTAAAVQEVYS